MKDNNELSILDFTKDIVWIFCSYPNRDYFAISYKCLSDNYIWSNGQAISRNEKYTYIGDILLNPEKFKQENFISKEYSFKDVKDEK